MLVFQTNKGISGYKQFIQNNTKLVNLVTVASDILEILGLRFVWMSVFL